MAEQVVKIEGTVPVSGSLSTTPSGIQDVNITNSSPLNTNQQGALAASPTFTAITNGDGAGVTFASAKNSVTLFILVNGAVSAGVVDLQASHDGVTWTKIGSSAPLSAGVNQSVSLMPGAAFLYFRGSVSTTVVGGTVTGTIMFA